MQSRLSPAHQERNAAAANHSPKADHGARRTAPDFEVVAGIEMKMEVPWDLFLHKILGRHVDRCTGIFCIELVDGGLARRSKRLIERGSLDDDHRELRQRQVRTDITNERQQVAFVLGDKASFQSPLSALLIGP